MVLFSHLPTERQQNFKIKRYGRYICTIKCDGCDIEYEDRYSRVWHCQETYQKDLCKACLRSHLASNRTEETLQKLSSSLKGKSKSEEHRKNLSIAVSGENHHMYGKGYWNGKNEKYNKHLDEWKGKTLQDIFGDRSKEISKKLSKSRIGEKNPMYGKPSPIGSGNGWSGWYQSRYFRSLLELSFMIQYPNSISAETIAIEYFLEDKKRTYHPDFLLDEVVIEVKPKKLVNTMINQKKYEAAKKIYGDKFLIYTEDDIMKLTLDDITVLVDNGDVKFIDRYKKKYEDFLANTSIKIL